MSVMQVLLDRYSDKQEKLFLKRNESRLPVEGIEKFLDISYVDDGLATHKLDVYRPENAGILPIIVDIHGGAWFFGSKEMNSYYCHLIAKEGFVVVNINYRLIREGQDGTFPNNITDVFAAYDWIYDHIAEYGGDRERAYLTGDSAGAHLACLSQIIDGDESLSADLGLKSRLKFRAQGLNCPVTDVDGFAERGPIYSYLNELFFGKGWETHKYRYFGNFKKTTMNVPPTFINTSDGDFLGKDSEDLAKRLKDEGKDCEFVRLTGNGRELKHAYSVIYPEWEESREATMKMLEFFRDR